MFFSLLEECFDFNQTFFQQKMLVKHHLTWRLHVVTLLIQQMLYNNVRTYSQGFKGLKGTMAHNFGDLHVKCNKLDNFLLKLSSYFVRRC